MDMKKSFSFSSITIVLLVVVVLVMSVGYANFSRDLVINGSATVGASSWNIKFLDNTYSETTGSATVASDDLKISETTMSYTVTLAEPGDFYEFTINAKNDGTFDAVLDGITMSALTEAQQKYLTYEVSYAGTSYTESQTGLGIALNSGAEVPVKVTVRYFQPTLEADLPDEEQKVTLNAALSFKQKVE